MIFRLSPIGAPYGSDGARLFRGGQLGGDARHVASQLRMPFKTIPLAMSKSRVKRCTVASQSHNIAPCT